MRPSNVIILTIILLTAGCGGGQGDPMAPPAAQQESTQQSTAPAPAPAPVPPAETPPTATPPTPAPEPVRALVTLQVTGTHTVGTISGWFTYDLNATPTFTDLHGWSNKVYRPTAWHLEATSTHPDLPGTVFDSTKDGHSFEWCSGTCILAAGDSVAMTLHDGHDKELRLSWPRIGNESNRPPTLAAIGPVPADRDNNGWFRWIGGAVSIVLAQLTAADPTTNQGGLTDGTQR